MPYAPNHNIALTQASALMLGRKDIALEHAIPLTEEGPDYSSMITATSVIPRELVMARFGLWRDILRSSVDPLSLSSNYTLAEFWYSTGLAQAGLGMEQEAEEALEALVKAAAAIQPGFFPQGHPWFGNYEEMGEVMVLTLRAKLELVRIA